MWTTIYSPTFGGASAIRVKSAQRSSPKAVQRDTQIIVSLIVIGFQVYGVAEPRDRVVQAIKVHQCEAEVVMHVGDGGLTLDGLGDEIDGGGKLTDLQRQSAEHVQSLNVVWFCL